MDLKSNLARIKELSDSVELKSIAKKDFNRVKYQLGKGECEGIAIFKDKDLSIQIAWLKPNTYFPKHPHKEIEFLVILEGDLTNENGSLREYNKGECVIIPKNTAHHVYTINGCKLVAITPTFDEGYPDV